LAVSELSARNVSVSSSSVAVLEEALLIKGSRLSLFFNGEPFI
jgi:hypothetical protein